MTIQNLKQILLMSLVFALTACSSPQGSKRVTAEDIPDRVLSRSDNLSDRPNWVQESQMFKLDAEYVTALGSATIPGSHRLEAGYRVALSNAKSGLASAIDQKLDFIFQNAEEGTGVEPQRVRYIGAEASKLAGVSILPAKFYWEKIATTLDGGERVTQYRIFAAVQMSSVEFRRAILASLRGYGPKVGLTEDFARKVDEQWDRLTRAPEASESVVAVQAPVKQTASVLDVPKPTEAKPVLPKIEVTRVPAASN